jgi:hypothetical protein
MHCKNNPRLRDPYKRNRFQKGEKHQNKIFTEDRYLLPLVIPSMRFHPLGPTRLGYEILFKCAFTPSVIQLSLVLDSVA